MKNKYKIQVIRPYQKTLTFTVDDYRTTKDNIIEFVDKVTGKTKQFDPRVLEIEVLR